MVLSFSFQNPNHKNISTSFAEKFGAEKNFVFLTPVSIKKFESRMEEFFKLINELQPDLIVGFGEFSGRFDGDIKIETVCRNRFRNSILGKKEAFDLYFGSDLISTIEKCFLSIKYKMGKGMGNSWCNLACYKICEYLRKTDSSIKLSFVHVLKT